MTDRVKLAATRAAGPKFIVIVFLTLAMAVPLFLIQLVLSDRQSTAADAAAQVATGWGGPQTIAGPLLAIPYVVNSAKPAEKGKMEESSVIAPAQRQVMLLLPKDLRTSIHADTQTRKRGIFSVPIYNSKIDIHASFDKAALAALFPADATPLWNQATISISVSDAQGLADNVTLAEGGSSQPFQPGFGPNFPLRTNDEAGRPLNAIYASLALEGPRDIVIDTELALHGSREIYVTPLGDRTVTTMDSAWPNPSFAGAFLPSSRTVTAQGFKATWIVPYLARGFGQSFSNPNEAVSLFLKSSFGVRFYQPVDYYQLVARSLKYAILFVALAFLVFFVMETMSQQRLHAAQYALVGAAQTLFYLLLLSLSEYVGFSGAYMIGAVATVGLTGLYASAVFDSVLRAGFLSTVLAGLYTLLYVILNAQDFALLIGSCVLFAALAATMFVTRRIDWFRMAEET